MAEVKSIQESAGTWLSRRMPRAMEAVGIRSVAKISSEIDHLCPAYHTDNDERHSPPGSPPYKETGTLQANLSHAEFTEGSDYVSRIKSNRPPQNGESDEVPMFLEFGTEKMAARPYMRPSMNRVPQLVPASLRLSLSSEATNAAAG